MLAITVKLLLCLNLFLGPVMAESGSGELFNKLLPEEIFVTIEPDCSNDTAPVDDNSSEIVIIITWVPPSDTVLEYQGELRLAPTQNGSSCLALNFTSIIPPFLSSSKKLQIMADEHSHPIYGCNYLFILSCEYEVLETEIFTSNIPHINLDYNCFSVYNRESHSYTLSLEWNVITNRCSVSSVIDEFSVSLWHGDTQQRNTIVLSDIRDNGSYIVTYSNLNELNNDVYNFQLTSITNNTPSTNTQSCSVSAPIVLLPPTQLIVTEYRILNLVNFATNIQLKATWTPPAFNINLFDYYSLSVIDANNLSFFNTIIPLAHSFVNTRFVINGKISQLFVRVRLINSACQSDSCSSPWSESVPLTNETSCSVSSHIDTIIKPFPNEEEAIRNGRCYAACVDQHASGILNSTINEVWPSVSPNQFDCTTANKVYLCYKGCLISSEHSVKNYICTYDCIGQCKMECDDSLSCQRGGGCPRECEFTYCSNGCGLLQESGNMTVTAPVGFSIAMPTRSIIGGEYSIDINYDNNMENDGRSLVDHAFIIRIVEEDGSISYIMQESLSIPVNLTYFNCKTVQLSVAIVTSFGMLTVYTDPITLIIYGETLFPSHPNPTNFTFTFDEDFRSDFDGHSIINIFWEKPENYDLLTSYEITVTPKQLNCGGRAGIVITNIDKNITNYTVQSENPNDLPMFICRYRIEIRSVPARPGDEPVGKTFSIYQVSRQPPPIIVNCSTVEQDTQTGVMIATVTWLYPFEIPLLEATTHFRIIPQFVLGHSTSVFGILSQLPYNVDINFTSNVYTESLNYFPVDIDYAEDTFRVKVEPIRGGDYRHRRLPSAQSCFFNAVSSLPSTVNFTNITILELSQRIIVNIIYSIPSETYSRNVEYELTISETELSYNQTVLPTNSITILTEATNITINELNRFDRNISCYYLQVRARTPFAIGNWNSPLILGDDHCKDEDEPVTSSVVSPSLPMSIFDSSTTQYTTPKVSPTIIDKDQSTRVSLPIIASVIVIVIIVIAITMVIICLLILNHKNNKQLKVAVEDTIESDWMGGKRSHMTSDLVCDEWEIPIDKLVIEEKLNEGVFGKVYYGHVKGPTTNQKVPVSIRNNLCIPVAIKMLKDGSSGKDKRDFLNEMDIMKTISQFSSSPHIVTLIGCVTVQEPVVLAMSFVKHGDLWKYLQHIRKNLSSSINNNENHQSYTEELPYKSLGAVVPVDLLSFAYQIASGMEYISSLGIVHRDLAARNVLVEDEKTLKISDFGMSCIIGTEEVYVKTTRGRLPWKWMSIESLRNREFSSNSDVWSFGVTLWEIATLGGFPYPSVTNSELQAHLESGARLEKPSNVSAEVYDIMLSCWEVTQSRRPTFIELRNIISNLITKSTGTTYIDLVADLDEAYYANNSDGGNLFDDLNDHDGYDHITAITNDRGEYNNNGYDSLRETNADYDQTLAEIED